jgi:hemolysin-activating ACP:hemolysin acyltransferase
MAPSLVALTTTTLAHQMPLASAVHHITVILFYDQAKPIGVLFWAMADEDTAKRISAGETKLRPQDWKSGNKMTLVEVVAPFGGAEEMVKDWKLIGRQEKN